MAKKLNFLFLCFLGAVFTFVGCSDDPYDDGINWEGDNGGLLEIFNGSPTKDIIVFYGGVPAPSNIIGGVRGGSTTTFDMSKHVSDFNVGGYIILRGMTKEQYEENKADLGKAKVEFNAMATYHPKNKYRVQIDANYMGDYAVRLVNTGRIGLELRKDSPEGEKVAYLPALQQNQMLYTNSTNAITLFPVYVFYDRSNQSITTLKSTSMRNSVGVAPRPAQDESQIPTAYFPNDKDAWNEIVKGLKSPVAYITVINNVGNNIAYFTNAGSRRYYSQGGYDALNGGERLIFEVNAIDEEEGGQKTNLVAMVYGEPVPIRFEDDPDNSPTIYNGYNYTVEIEEDHAYITKGSKRDLSKELESL